MAELLTTKEILVALENIIKRAEKYICIFTYNIKIDPNYLVRLRNASKRGIKIIVVFGVDNGDDNIIEELRNMSNCTVYFKEYLHAKFYYNEKELLIGSMNLSEASAKNNFELGVLFRSEEYAGIIKKVKEEAKEIISDSVLWEDLMTPKKAIESSKPLVIPKKQIHIVKSVKGSCVRCKSEIKYNLGKPLCKTCFYSWSEWENEYYLEQFCHTCGKKKKDISFAKPQCITCYKN